MRSVPSPARRAVRSPRHALELPRGVDGFRHRYGEAGAPAQMASARSVPRRERGVEGAGGDSRRARTGLAFGNATRERRGLPWRASSRRGRTRRAARPGGFSRSRPARVASRASGSRSTLPAAVPSCVARTRSMAASRSRPAIRKIASAAIRRVRSITFQRRFSQTLLQNANFARLPSKRENRRRDGVSLFRAAGRQRRSATRRIFRGAPSSEVRNQEAEGRRVPPSRRNACVAPGLRRGIYARGA